MNALDLMHHDHGNMRRLLDDAANEGDPQRRANLLATIRAELAVHELMEEQVFYPALQKDATAKDVVLEAFQEHHVADVILDELMEVPPEADVWKAKVQVLKENLEHHIEEEESEMFEHARRLFSDEQLEDLGRRMERVRGGGD